jgi:hypothetical protein
MATEMSDMAKDHGRVAMKTLIILDGTFFGPSSMRPSYWKFVLAEGKLDYQNSPK